MGIMEILRWCVFGLIVGAIARALLPGKQRMSVPLTGLLGIVGSFAGGAAWSLVFRDSEGLLKSSGWIMSVAGAFVILFVYSMVVNKK